MAIFEFGSGVLLGTRTDIANATPINFGLVQEVQLDLSYSTKELYGAKSIRAGDRTRHRENDRQGEMAQISGIAFNNLFFGMNVAAGYTATAFGEAGTIPGSSAYTVTVANAGSFVADYGVVYSATGLPLSKVASAPAAGQYCVSAGTYTFNSADAGKAVLISYTYTVAGSGEKIPVTNQLLGTTPTFQAQLFTTFQGKTVSVALYNCVSTKLAYATKLEDFVVPELDFSIFANAAGNVLDWSFSEAS